MLLKEEVQDIILQTTKDMVSGEIDANDKEEFLEACVELLFERYQEGMYKFDTYLKLAHILSEELY